MKKLTLVAFISLIASSIGCAQTSEIKAIEKTITAFSKAGDENNANELEKYLDDNHRIVMNRLFGSQEVTVMLKSVYVDKIRNKEFGGDTRKLTIANVIVNGSTANAKVTFQGSKMTMVSLITLVKNSDGVWKIISDVPVII